MSNHFGNIFTKILRTKTRTKPTICNKSTKSAKSKKAEPYVILRATRSDFPKIVKLMQAAYYPQEPTCFALGIKNNPILNEMALRSMTEGLTLVARYKYDGCIIGASINQTSNPWDPELTEKFACNVECPKVKQLLLFHAHIQRLPDLWNCYKVQKVFEIDEVFVRSDHRHKGIASKLMLASKILGADCGFTLIRCDATSEYTAKICQNMKMTKIADVPYCTYIGKDLEPVFRPPTPHEAVKIFIEVDPQVPRKDK